MPACLLWNAAANISLLLLQQQQLLQQPPMWPVPKRQGLATAAWLPLLLLSLGQLTVACSIVN
jgi:hypothetical protein